MLNNWETHSSNEKETPTSIERGTFGVSYDKLAGAQQRIASQKNEGPSQFAEISISDAKWAELGGKPRNPTPEFETPTPTSSTQPPEVWNTTDTTPQNTEEPTINTPPKKEEIEAGNGNLVSIGHKVRAMPESGDITVSVGAHPATKGTSETPSEESTTTEAPIVWEIPTPGAAPEDVKKFMKENPAQASGVDPDEFAASFFPRDGTAVDPQEYGLQSDYLYSATGDFSMKIPKENATLENTLLQEESTGEGYTSLYDQYDQKPSQFTRKQIWQESPVVGMPEYRQKIDDKGTLRIYKPWQEDTPEYTFEKGFKSDGHEGASVDRKPTKTPTEPESSENSASEKEPSATSEEVDIPGIPKGFEKTIKDPMMNSEFTWKDGKWVAPEWVEAFEKVKSQKGAWESLAFLINQSAWNSIPDGFAYQFENGKIVIAPKKN